MGATVVTIDYSIPTSGKKIVYGKLAMSASYAAGGDTYTLQNFGLDTLERLILTPNSNVNGAVLEVDKTNKKILAKRVGAAGTDPAPVSLKEVAAAVDLSALVADFIAIGN